MIRKTLFMTAAFLVVIAMSTSTGMHLNSASGHKAFAKDKISKQEALDIVLDEYGGEPDGELDDAVEEEHGGDIYEVEVVDSSEGNIEVNVDAYSGEIDKDSIEHDNISKEEAGKIATDKYGGEIKEIEQEHEDGILVYEVEIRNSDEGRIEVDVTAGSGEIYGMEKEDSDDDDEGGGDDNGDNDQISKEEAGKIVTDKYGGEVINVEEEEGGDVYEVEVKNSDEGRIEVDVDAYSGKIKNVEHDNDDNGDNGEGDLISKEKAGQIATDKYGGDVISVEKEHEDGNLVYEVEIKNSKQGRIEVDVDAHTGEIVGMEKEDEDDNNDQDQNATGNNQNGGNGGSGTDNEEGGQLAKTSSTYPLGALAGLLLVIAGGTLFFFKRRNHAKKVKPSHS